jgi:hypothetical protein
MVLTGYIPFLQSQNTGMPTGMAPGMKVPGYIILSSGDTVYGELKWALKYVENNPVEIKFTAENGISKDLKRNYQGLTRSKNKKEVEINLLSAFAPQVRDVLFSQCTINQFNTTTLFLQVSKNTSLCLHFLFRDKYFLNMSPESYRDCIE